MFSNEELKIIYKSLNDYVSDYEEMDDSKIAPIILKIKDILEESKVETQEGKFLPNFHD